MGDNIRIFRGSNRDVDFETNKWDMLMKKEIFEKIALRVGKTEAFKLLQSAMASTNNFARAGFATTPPEALATRESTCRACPEWDAAALNNTGRCRKCGCSTWAKLRMATERCPLGKWEAEEKPETGNLRPEISPSATPAPPRESSAPLLT